MQHLSKRRGVISVFLLIIYMITYVFMGMLVDAGRYQMAQTYAESALDSASSSILAEYNQMLFDLYGLFSVDLEVADGSTMEAAIKERYEHYLDEVLGIAKLDDDKYRTLLSDLFSDGEDVNTTTATLYDFKQENLTVGTQITLADYASVENQIIEYMKFRAPVQLVSEMGGFLDKLKVILQMKDRLLEKKKQLEITGKEEYKKVATSAQEVLTDINKFGEELSAYSINPFNITSGNTSGDPYKLMQVATDFDNQITKHTKQYNTDRGEEIQRFEERQLSLLENLQYYQRELVEELSSSLDITLNTSYKVDTDYYEGTGTTSRKLSEISLDDVKNVESLLEYLAGKTGSVGTRAQNIIDTEDNKEDGKAIASSARWGAEVFADFEEKYEDEVVDHEETLKNIKMTYKTNCDGEVSNLKTRLETIETNAKYLYNRAVSLKADIESVVSTYEAYITELEAAQKDASDADLGATIYGSEIELAKANAGELLQNYDLICNGREYTKLLGYGFYGESKEKLSTWLPIVAELVVDNLVNGANNNKISATKLQTALQDGQNGYTGGAASADLHENSYLPKTTSNNVYVQASKELLTDAQCMICRIYSHASYYIKGHYCRDVDVVVGSTGKSPEEISQEEMDQSEYEKTLTDEKKDEEEGKKIDRLDKTKKKTAKELLSIQYTYTAAISGEEIDASMDVSGKADESFVAKAMDEGLKIIDKITALLEDARDNLYVNAYIMSTFPNYKTHYKLAEENKDNKLLKAPYEDNMASYAEVEFIVTGAGASWGEVYNTEIDSKVGFTGMKSVATVRTQLFGTRVLFNAFSMFTDSAKYSQAQALSAWAGPFAPLVMVVLMVAWLVAESVLDVMVLMGDKTNSFHADDKNKKYQVALIKPGKEWFISVEGMVAEVANTVVDSLVDEITEQTNTLISSLEEKVDIMVYDAYKTIQDSSDAGMDSVLTEGQNMVTNWTNEFVKNVGDSELKTFAGTLSAEVNSTMSTAMEGAKDKKNELLTNAKEKSIAAIGKVSNQVMKKADQCISNVGSGVKTALAKNMDKIIPIGTVVNTGDDNSTTIYLGYEDYMNLYLFLLNQDIKVKRIMAVIQANMIAGGQDKFKMEKMPVSVWADYTLSIKYMFMSNSILPDEMRKDGRIWFKVISAQSY